MPEKETSRFVLEKDTSRFVAEASRSALGGAPAGDGEPDRDHERRSGDRDHEKEELPEDRGEPVRDGERLDEKDTPRIHEGLRGGRRRGAASASAMGTAREMRLRSLCVAQVQSRDGGSRPSRTYACSGAPAPVRGRCVACVGERTSRAFDVGRSCSTEASDLL